MRRTRLNRGDRSAARRTMLAAAAGMMVLAAACSDDGGNASISTTDSTAGSSSVASGDPSGSSTTGPGTTGPATGPATTAALTQATDPPSSPSTSSVVEIVSIGQEWKPGCKNVVTTGGAVPSASVLDSLATFRALPASPQLDITVPRSPLFPDNIVSGGPTDDAGYVFVAATRRGIVLGINPSSLSENASSMVTFIDHGGVRRWTRCFPERLLGVFASPTSSGPTATGPNPIGSVYIATLTERGDGPSSANWQSLALTNGTPDNVFADAAEQAGLAVADMETYRVLEAQGDLVLLGRDRDTSIMPTALAVLDVRTGKMASPPLVSAAGADGCGTSYPYGFTSDGHLTARGPVADGISPTVAVWTGERWTNDPTQLRALPMDVTFGCGETPLLRGVDGTGAPRWSRPELQQPGLEGVYIARDGDSAVMQVCAGPPPAEGICPIDLVGIDARTGATRWSLPGFREVPIGVNDGKVITNVGDTLSNDETTRGWAMFDAETGAAIAGQRWDDAAAFHQGCCGEGEYFHVHAFGGVVIVVADDHVRVWYPADAPVKLAASSLALP